MQKLIILTECDICKKQMDKRSIEYANSLDYRTLNPIERKQITIIFRTEQTEGNFVTPYLTQEKLHICESCMKQILLGKQVFGVGAMGNNKYSI